MLFSQEEYARLHSIVFRDDYPGYKPSVREAPNGDGKIDATKRYAHVALKYLHKAGACTSFDDWCFLFRCLSRAHREAERVAVKLGVPEQYLPHEMDATLRVLEYPPGAGSELHTDFDLFTLLCYRNTMPGDDSPLIFMCNEGEQENSREWRKLQRTSPGMHLGEIGELVGLGKATPHYVLPEHETQHSIVYFAIPDHAAVLPSQVTVGDWIKERIARSRY